MNARYAAIFEHVGCEIRRCRLAAKLTREQLAARSEFLAGPEDVARVERGDISLHVDALLIVANILDVRLGPLFKDAERAVMRRTSTT